MVQRSQEMESGMFFSFGPESIKLYACGYRGVGFYSSLSLIFVDSNTSVDRNQV